MFRCLFSVFLPIFLSVYVARDCTSSCATFFSRCSVKNIEEELTATLTFGVVNVCVDGHETTLISIKRKEGHQQVPFCQLFLDANGSCRTNDGCSCGSGSRPYSTTRRISDTADELWTLTATLTNGATFAEDVKIKEDCIRKNSPVTEDSAEKPISGGSGFFKTTTEQSVTSSAKLTSGTLLVSTEEPGNEQKGEPSREAKIYMVTLMSVIGCLVLSFVVIAVLIGIMLKKRATRPTQGLPPPPVPHTFRRHVMDDVVMFHAQGPPHVQRDSDSFVSVQGHIYELIPDDTGTSDNSSTNIDSMSGSDSSLWDTVLHHIACPSSDSSLGSTESSKDALTLTTSAPDPSHTSSPESQSTLPEDYLHPIACPAEETTTGSPSLTTSSNTMESPFAQRSLPNDYLHPIVSSKAAAIATTTAAIASETPSVRSLQNLEATVGTSSKRNRKNAPRSKTHKNLPKDYLHPIVSSKGADTDISSESSTKKPSLPLQSSLPEDCIRHTASQLEAAAVTSPVTRATVMSSAAPALLHSGDTAICRDIATNVKKKVSKFNPTYENTYMNVP